ncbi:hypothetical protein J5I95_13045 [Candidatus Poribacteria bacterium]|nr:hypothetical protein [Candidatus Poribacteria bacterium]
MKQYFQIPLLGLAISLILSCVAVNAETPKVATAQVKYSYYYRFNTHSEQKYHRFLPNPVPEELYYYIRMTADGNIDDTRKKETVVLMVVGSKPHLPYGSREFFGNWVQAFLLITDNNAGQPEKKAFFKIFDTGTHALEVPAAKGVELHASPFVFTRPTDVFFRLADVTGDGTLDVWVESAYGVALISFENGEFKEVFSNYTVTRKKLTATPEIESYWYQVRHEPEGHKYHRFLPPSPAKGVYYDTQRRTTANIDDTPEKENIVLMTTEIENSEPRSESVQVFLLIAENEGDMLKKKALFTLFDAGTYDLEVSAKNSELQRAHLVLPEILNSPAWLSGHVWFRLVDLTGDGTLDVWVESYYGVAVISFQDGKFKEVCNVYSSHRREDPIEYIDLDNDGIYEIKIPTRISVDGIPGAAYPEWVSLYKWDGTTYVLNNETFYAENDQFLNRALRNYNGWSQGFGKCEEQRFYIGLIYYYRDNAPKAREFLQWVVEHGKKQDYRKAAESFLKKLPHH